MLTRNPAGRAPGVPLLLTCLFNRPIEQAPRAHEVQDSAAQGPPQPGPGRQPHTAVPAHRTRTDAQKRSNHRGVAGVAGQEEGHLRLMTSREPCGGLGLLFRVEEGIVALAARRLPIVPGDARRAEVHAFRSLPWAACGQRAATRSGADAAVPLRPPAGFSTCCSWPSPCAVVGRRLAGRRHKVQPVAGWLGTRASPGRWLRPRAQPRARPFGHLRTTRTAQEEPHQTPSRRSSPGRRPSSSRSLARQT